MFILGTVAHASDQRYAPVVKLETTVFETNMRGEEDARRINRNIEVLGKGIERVVVDAREREVKVTYDPRMSSDAKIIRGLSKLGIKAKVKKTPKRVHPNNWR